MSALAAMVGVTVVIVSFGYALEWSIRKTVHLIQRKMTSRHVADQAEESEGAVRQQLVCAHDIKWDSSSLADMYGSGSAESGGREAEPEPAQPGRQAIETKEGGQDFLSGMLGHRQARWTPAPRKFQCAPYEEIHTFAPGAKPKRDPHYGLISVEPPQSLICPACDLEQPPMTSGERTCGYCGLHLKVHGTRILWWRDQTSEVAEWKP